MDRNPKQVNHGACMNPKELLNLCSKTATFKPKYHVHQTLLLSDCASNSDTRSCTLLLSEGFTQNEHLKHLQNEFKTSSK
jgi:hypothetical protein